MTGVTAASEQAIKVGRECGPCDLCCSVYPVPGVTGKDERCRFARSGTVTDMKVSVGESGIDLAPTYHAQTGCGIYSKRPRMCRQFYCGWRLGLGEDHERPDKTGVILDLAGSGDPSQAAVGVRVLHASPALFPDRVAVLAAALKLIERLEAGTAGPDWPAVPVVGNKRRSNQCI